MTRILLSLLVTFSIFSASAQFKKADMLIGADLSYSSNKTTSVYYTGEQKTNSGVFDISFGKAIKDNAVVGINLSYQPNLNTYNYGAGLISNRTDNYGIGIFYRVYKNLGKDFYLFGEAGGGYNGSTSSMTDSTGNKTSTGTGSGGRIYITPGIAYKISSKFFLELSIPEIFNAAYTSTKTKAGSVTINSSDAFAAGVNIDSNPLTSLGIGFRLIL
jgi:hypothetical protein